MRSGRVFAGGGEDDEEAGHGVPGAYVVSFRAFRPSFDLPVSIKVAMRLSKTFFCMCIASMAWGTSKSGQ